MTVSLTISGGCCGDSAVLKSTLWHVIQKSIPLLAAVLIVSSCNPLHCNRTDLYGSWKPGNSKLRTFNAMLDQEGPAQTSWCSEWAVNYTSVLLHSTTLQSIAILSRWLLATLLGHVGTPPGLGCVIV
jgi:hypothetical protein